ncbi:MAG: HepT-like ribonuclease domain-containing protein [Ginsengibacter sp.]|jgi:uncharacterized protein with HEPN domain
MKGTLSDKIRIQHILDAIGEIENYPVNSTFEAFISNSEKRFATIKQIEIIGEACKHLSNNLKQKHPDVQWMQINGFRNISVHEYFGVDLHIVWDIAKNDLPSLKINFTNILKDL